MRKLFVFQSFKEQHFFFKISGSSWLTNLFQPCGIFIILIWQISKESILEFFFFFVFFLLVFLYKFCHTLFSQKMVYLSCFELFLFVFSNFLSFVSLCPLSLENFFQHQDRPFVERIHFFECFECSLDFFTKSDANLRECILTSISLIVFSLVNYGSSFFRGIIKTPISPKGIPYGWVGGGKKVPSTKGGKDEANRGETPKAWNRPSKTTKEVGA